MFGAFFIVMMVVGWYLGVFDKDDGCSTWRCLADVAGAFAIAVVLICVASRG